MKPILSQEASPRGLSSIPHSHGGGKRRGSEPLPRFLDQGEPARRRPSGRCRCDELAELARTVAASRAASCNRTSPVRKPSARLGAPAIDRFPAAPGPGGPELKKTPTGSPCPLRTRQRHR